MRIVSYATRWLGLALSALVLGVGCLGSGASSETDQASPKAEERIDPPRFAEVPAPEQPSSPVTPPYFLIQGNGGADLRVMGTIHFGPAEGWRFPPGLASDLRDADAFVLEIDLREVSEGEVARILADRVVLPVSVTIDDVLSARTNQLLRDKEDLLAEFGMPRSARSRLKPWFVAVSLIESVTLRTPYSTARSVEQTIVEQLDHRPLLGLETFEAQLALFDALSPEQQDLVLNDTVRRLHESAEGIEQLALAWSRNDQRALEQIAYQGVDELPDLAAFYEVLLTDRNRAWVPQLSALLEDPLRAGETIFVGVGALHLVGPDSLIQMLSTAGYPTEIIHPAADPSS